MFSYPEPYRLATPPIITSMMVILAVISRVFFVDNDAVISIMFYLQLALFPLVIIWHLLLIFDNTSLSKLDSTFYGLIHGPLAFVVWTFSIMFQNSRHFL